MMENEMETTIWGLGFRVQVLGFRTCRGVGERRNYI